MKILIIFPRFEYERHDAIILGYVGGIFYEGLRADYSGCRTRNTREVDHFPLRSRSSIFRSAPRCTSLEVH